MCTHIVFCGSRNAIMLGWKFVKTDGKMINISRPEKFAYGFESARILWDCTGYYRIRTETKLGSFRMFLIHSHERNENTNNEREMIQEV